MALGGGIFFPPACGCGWGFGALATVWWRARIKRITRWRARTSADGRSGMRPGSCSSGTTRVESPLSWSSIVSAFTSSDMGAMDGRQLPEALIGERPWTELGPWCLMFAIYCAQTMGFEYLWGVVKNGEDAIPTMRPATDRCAIPGHLAPCVETCVPFYFALDLMVPPVLHPDFTAHDGRVHMVDTEANWRKLDEAVTKHHLREAMRYFAETVREFEEAFASRGMGERLAALRELVKRKIGAMMAQKGSDGAVLDMGTAQPALFPACIADLDIEMKHKARFHKFAFLRSVRVPFATAVGTFLIDETPKRYRDAKSVYDDTKERHPFSCDNAKRHGLCPIDGYCGARRNPLTVYRDRVTQGEVLIRRKTTTAKRKRWS